MLKCQKSVTENGTLLSNMVKCNQSSVYSMYVFGVDSLFHSALTDQSVVLRVCSLCQLFLALHPFRQISTQPGLCLTNHSHLSNVELV